MTSDTSLPAAATTAANLQPASPPAPAAIPAVPPAPLHLLLDLDAAAVSVLKRDAATLLTPEKRPVTRKLRQTFWDTTDHRIGRAGLALALQTAARRRHQIICDIKLAPAGGRLWRCQETPLANDALDVTRLAFMPGSDPSLAASLADAMLVPVFALDITRMAWRATLVDATLAVTLDATETEAASGRSSALQLDIALIDGPPDAIYRLARKLLPAFPCGLAAEDPVQAGYRLAAGGSWWPVPTDDEKLLKPHMSVREGFLAIGRAGIAHVREEMRRLETAPEPEHIHQTRVSLRRLRSVLTVFADVLPPLSRRHFGDALGELANLLGKAREWDVLLDGTIAPLAKALGQDKALDELSGAATARRDSAAGSIRSHVGSADFLRLSLALGSWFDAGIWPDAVTPAESALLDQPLIRFAVALLRRRHRKFVRAGEAVEQSDADKLHQLRIEAKKLRYTTEFLRGLFPAKAVRRYISALKEIQEILGTANDAAVAQLLVPQLVLGDGTEGARAAGLIAGWSAAEAAAARRHFARAWEEFRETKRFW